MNFRAFGLTFVGLAILVAVLCSQAQRWSDARRGMVPAKDSEVFKELNFNAPSTPDVSLRLPPGLGQAENIYPNLNVTGLPQAPKPHLGQVKRHPKSTSKKH